MIKIIPLVENTSISKEFHSKHGLCLYIETIKHKILFDLGPNKLFIKNANKMNIDLSKIDTVIISHGHKDHGGALREFININKHAKIYIKEDAFDEHFIKVLGFYINVGLDKKLKYENQIELVSGNMNIDDELFLFSNVKQEECHLKSNSVLYRKKDGHLELDDFRHEQNLIIRNNDNYVLFSGCSHSGIINIINEAKKITSNNIKNVIGGFHLYNPPTKRYESNEIIDKLAILLLQNNSNYYTCHCTGKKAFLRMRNILSDRLCYLSVGIELKL